MVDRDHLAASHSVWRPLRATWWGLPKIGVRARNAGGGASKVWPMEELLQQTLSDAVDAATAAADGGLGPATSANGLVFLLIAALGLLMALVYVPIRLFLTITARQRRFRLLQRIRRLRDDLGQPLEGPPSEGQPPGGQPPNGQAHEGQPLEGQALEHAD